uniref:Histone-lysine N-methyltransferase, H3 lysine-9 specific SUVH6 n=1 Tax=Aegilops tauschii subsp. strangulata TaxID=200361 RepID=A0A453KPB3_AEGTS
MAEGTKEVGDAIDAVVVSSAACNGDLPHAPPQPETMPEERKEGRETHMDRAGVSSVACNGDLPHALPQPETEGMVQLRKEGGEAHMDTADVPSVASNSDLPHAQPSSGGDARGQAESRAIEVMPLAFAAPKSFAVASVNGSVENGGDGAESLLMEGNRGLGSGRLVREEDVAGNGNGSVMENRTGNGELERKEDGHDTVRKKRWLMSAVNPPPKRRAISAVRNFPPGCGRDAVTGTGSGVEEGSVLEATPISFATRGASVVDALTTAPVSGHGASPVVVRDASNEEVQGKRAEVVGAGDGEVRGKFDGTLRKGTPKTYVRSRFVDAKTKGKRPKDVAMNDTLRGDGTLKNKNSRDDVRSNSNTKHGVVKLKSYGIGKDSLIRSSKESKCGNHDMTNQSEETDDLTFISDKLIVQALMAPDKCPWTKGRKSSASASNSLTPRNKSLPPKKPKKKDATPRKELPPKVTPSTSAVHEKIEHGEYSCLEDDDNPMALVVHERKELCVTLPPCAPFGDQSVDARSKVRKLLKLFQLICRKLMQAEEQQLRNVGRIDLEAVEVLKKYDGYSKPDAIVGSVPGVVVGDEFHFRVELSIVGLHRIYQGGIDSAIVDGTRIAISIVASGGYPDELSSSDELIYTGSGGKATGKKEAEDQKLKGGNLALKNCIKTKTPVRVIHGFKGQSRSEVGHSKSKQISTYTYDGLYVVVDCWQEGASGSMVFKYKLKRIPGQPELALHIVKETRMSKVRKGLRCPDISLEKERIPICVINTIDDAQPTPFEYITKVIYPPSYAKEPPHGCDCTDGCSDSSRCACAVKNGGEIPFNFNGAIVHAKPLIYECGPSCRCPPTCHNRASQHGIKIPLEIFKTGETGWGVRSLSSISSGSFICEYAGELLQDTEAEKIENDEYLFDIGHNYDDEELWKGLPSMIPGLESSTSETMQEAVGFTIDAAKCGNVGRFINHSCSPNLYAQNVLWDHDDKRMPHIMFFAAENIPPLQELTYHYNYTIGQVRDKNGVEKVKECLCGSADCCHRLY